MEQFPVIAALYVEPRGCYIGLDGVDPWTVDRDARKYTGPFPVVAHPPCARWGRYWSGGPSAKTRRMLGDDGGCFAAALRSVRQWGGVIEHPEASKAWEYFGIHRPPRGGGWVVADEYGGWTCCVEQGHYGHRARKATWLYAVGCDLPSLKWGPSISKARLDLGFHSREERIGFYASKSWFKGPRKSELMDEWERQTGKKMFGRLTKNERLGTPIPFRDLLISIARSAKRPVSPSPMVADRRR